MMPNKIIIDGIEYELKRKIPEPKFKVDDAVSNIHDTSKTVRRITHISHDRYLLDGEDSYFLIVEQDDLKLIGKYTFELVENAK